MNIKRGDVFMADLDAGGKGIGSEQCGRRPVLILQNDKGNIHAPTTIVAIITSQNKKSMPTHISFFDENVLPFKSLICTEQIRTIDMKRLYRHCGNVGEDVMHQVEKAIGVSLDIKLINEREESMIENSNVISISESVYRETELDRMEEKNWLQIIENQIMVFSNVQQYLINLKIKKKDLDDEIEQIIDFLAGSKFNAAKGFKIYQLLRDRSTERNRLKEEIDQVGAIVHVMDCETHLAEYQKCRIVYDEKQDQNRKKMPIVISELLKEVI